MPEKKERLFKVRGRSVGGPRYRGVLSSNGTETRSLRWTAEEVTRILPESVYLECKADKGMVITKIREVSPEEAEKAQAPKASAKAPPRGLADLADDDLFAELERREKARRAQQDAGDGEDGQDGGDDVDEDEDDDGQDDVDVAGDEPKG